MRLCLVFSFVPIYFLPLLIEFLFLYLFPFSFLSNLHYFALYLFLSNRITKAVSSSIWKYWSEFRVLLDKLSLQQIYTAQSLH
jgi:hypothetical protein